MCFHPACFDSSAAPYHEPAKRPVSAAPRSTGRGRCVGSRQPDPPRYPRGAAHGRPPGGRLNPGNGSAGPACPRPGERRSGCVRERCCSRGGWGCLCASWRLGTKTERHWVVLWLPVANWPFAEGCYRLVPFRVSRLGPLLAGSWGDAAVPGLSGRSLPHRASRRSRYSSRTSKTWQENMTQTLPDLL